MKAYQDNIESNLQWIVNLILSKKSFKIYSVQELVILQKYKKNPQKKQIIITLKIVIRILTRYQQWKCNHIV